MKGYLIVQLVYGYIEKILGLDSRNHIDRIVLVVKV